MIIDSPIQSLFNDIFGFKFYGLGLLSTIILLMFVGYLGSTILMDSVFKPIEKLFSKIPLVKEIYKALKDIVGAFLSEKKKFEKPVLVEVRDGINRIGFITSEDLDEYGISKDLISVYFPLSYAFTGELLIVNKEKIKPLKSKDTGSLMKFVISGGLVNEDEN